MTDQLCPGCPGDPNETCCKPELRVKVWMDKQKADMSEQKAEQKTRLRWKLEPRETGLRAICAGPRGSWLHDGTRRYAHVMHSRVCGWFWVAGWGSGVPHMNTSNTPSETPEEAKAAAMAYVKKHLAARTKEPRHG